MITKSYQLRVFLVFSIINLLSCHKENERAELKDWDSALNIQDSMPSARRNRVGICDRCIDSIAQITYLPYTDSLGDPLFWRIICHGLDAVPLLVEKLDDSTSTHIGIPAYGGDYTRGDVVYYAITEIICDIPTLDFIDDKFHDDSKGSYFVYIEYTRAGFEHRKMFQKKCREWCIKNIDSLTWTPITYDSLWPLRNPCRGCYTRYGPKE